MNVLFITLDQFRADCLTPRTCNDAADRRARRNERTSIAAHDQLDGRLGEGPRRILPGDDAGGHVLRPQQSLLDQRHDLAQQRHGVRASDKEADAQRVEAAERQRHVAAGIEADALADALGSGGSNRVLETLRREAGIDDDRIAPFRPAELAAYGPRAEALCDLEHLVVVAREVDPFGTQRDGCEGGIEWNALQA